MPGEPGEPGERDVCALKGLILYGGVLAYGDAIS